MTSMDVGLIGLGRTGRDMARRMVGQGIKVAVFSADPARLQSLEGDGVFACGSVKELVAALELPRRLLVFSTPGSAEARGLEALPLLLQEEDLIIDMGDTPFQAAEERARRIQSQGLYYLGVGLAGNAFIISGDPRAYHGVAPLFEAIAPEERPAEHCAPYVGPRGAAHYAMQVYQGLIRAEVRLAAEAGLFLKRLKGLSAAQRQVYPGRRAEERFQVRQRFGVNEESTALGVPTPTLVAAWNAPLSELQWEGGPGIIGDGPHWARAMEVSLRASRLCAWAQAQDLLRAASVAYEYVFKRAALASLWQRSTPLRSGLLLEICHSLETATGSDPLLETESFQTFLTENQILWQEALDRARQAGLPLSAMEASLHYYAAVQP